jgi:hypothetical protein
VARNGNSEVHRIYLQIVMSLHVYILIYYAVSAISRLTGVWNVLKILRRLHSVGSFMQNHDDTDFSKSIIAAHAIAIIAHVGKNIIGWVRINCRLDILPFFISCMLCLTVTSFAEIQFLNFVFIVRRHFVSLNSRLSEIITSRVKTQEIIPPNLDTTSELSLENSLVNRGLHELLNIHVTLCDVLDEIKSTYSLQVLASVGWKFVNITITLYLIFSVILDNTIFQVHSSPSLIFSISFEAMQLIMVVSFCKSASFQVGNI